jgi:hypothetical protein
VNCPKSKNKSLHDGHVVRVFSLCVLALLVPSLSQKALAQTDDDKFAVTDCRGQSAGICLKGECTCDEWQIKIYKKDGKEWGLITGKTLESAQRQLKKNQEFDVRYARFFGIAVDDPVLNYQRPGKPICRVPCGGNSSRSRSGNEDSKDEIAQAADDLQQKMIDEIIRVSKALNKIEKKVGNPYRAVGFVLKDYANTLKDVFKKQKELRAKLAETTASMNGTMADIESIFGEMQAADAGAQNAYNNLPNNARSSLENGDAAETGGAWNNQRVRDFDNSITLQTVNFSQSQITVTLISQSNAGSRVTYNLRASDILPETIAVEPTDAADRWMVTLRTNGRSITKLTERDTGALTDNVSKMTLFFSNEAAARAAADALRSNQ